MATADSSPAKAAEEKTGSVARSKRRIRIRSSSSENDEEPTFKKSTSKRERETMQMRLVRRSKKEKQNKCQWTKKEVLRVKEWGKTHGSSMYS